MKKELKFNDQIIEIDIEEVTSDVVSFYYQGTNYKVKLEEKNLEKMSLLYNQKNIEVMALDTHYVIDGIEYTVGEKGQSRSRGKAENIGQMTSPMPGKILKILIKENSKVEVGTPILVMEAMKMEHTIKATKAGVLEKLLYKEGDQVQGGVELVKIC